MMGGIVMHCGNDGKFPIVHCDFSHNATRNQYCRTEVLVTYFTCLPEHLDFLSLKMKWDRSTSLEKGYTKRDQNRNFILL